MLDNTADNVAEKVKDARGQIPKLPSDDLNSFVNIFVSIVTGENISNWDLHGNLMHG